MNRTLNAFFAMSLVFGSTLGLVGCRFCASPFDYCSPTYTGNDCDYYCSDPCDSTYVAGSRFLGTEGACQTGCTSCGEVVTSSSECSSCSTSYSSGGSSTYYESSGYEYESESEATPTRAKSLNGNGIQKIPPPAPAVPQKIQPPSAMKKKHLAGSQKALSVPKMVSPRANYASNQNVSYENAGDQVPISLAELRELNPDAVDVEILSVE